MTPLRTWGMLMTLVFWPELAQCTSTVDSTCISNMKGIDGVIQRWALEHKIPTNAPCSLSDPQLLIYFKDSALPVCPAGGRYLPGKTVSDNLTCTIHGTIEHAGNVMAEPGRIRSRQLYLCAFLSVILMTALTTPLPWFSEDVRRLFTVVMLPMILVLVGLLAHFGNPTGLIQNLHEGPALILTSFGAFLGLRLGIREKAWRKRYGAVFGTIYVVVSLFILRSVL